MDVTGPEKIGMDEDDRVRHQGVDLFLRKVLAEDRCSSEQNR